MKDVSEETEPQELILCGLSKGSVLLMHVMKLDRVFSRFAIHLEEIVFVKYLQSVNCFLSFCTENTLKIWHTDGSRPVILSQFKLCKKLRKILVLFRNEPQPF